MTRYLPDLVKQLCAALPLELRGTFGFAITRRFGSSCTASQLDFTDTAHEFSVLSKSLLLMACPVSGSGPALSPFHYDRREAHRQRVCGSMGRIAAG